MTDVSILFPLPSSASSLDRLLAPNQEGAHGTLLPFEVFELAPDLGFLFPDKTTTYAALRVVSARLDPCFIEVEGDACRYQVRLVMQPITTSIQPPTTDDAAVHAFYELEPAEFDALAAALMAAQSAEDASSPLGVHPAMDREQLEGQATDAIRAALLAHTGKAKLSRMTFMQLGGMANVWIFGGFTIKGGAPTPMGIVGTKETEQRLENNALPDPQDFHGQVVPVIQPDDLSLLYESDVASTKTDDELWPAYEAALRVENPSIHTSETVACVTCHAANAARLWADRKTDLEQRESAARFTSTHDLTQPTPIFGERSQTVRAFGYQGATPAVSQRVIHETAAVVDLLRDRWETSP